MPNPAAMYGGAPRLSDEMQRRALEDLLGAGVRGIGYTATAIPDAMTMLMRGVAEARPRFNKSPTEWRSDMPLSPAGDFIQGKITDAGYSDRPAAHIGGTALSMLLGAGLNKVAQAPMTAAQRGMVKIGNDAEDWFGTAEKTLIDKGAYHQGSGYFVTPSGSRVRVSDHHPINDRSTSDIYLIRSNVEGVPQIKEAVKNDNFEWSYKDFDYDELIRRQPRLNQSVNAFGQHPVTYMTSAYGPIDTEKFSKMPTSMLARIAKDSFHRNAQSLDRASIVHEMKKRGELSKIGLNETDLSKIAKYEIQKLKERLESVRDKRFVDFRPRPSERAFAESWQRQIADYEKWIKE